MNGARAVVVDDHEIVTQMLSTILENSGASVVATAKRWSDVVQLCKNTKPALLLVDVQLPPGGGDGLLAVAELRAAKLPVTVICLSASNEPKLVERAFKAGCDGFVSKVASAEEISSVCRSALAGESPVYDRRTAGLLAGHYKQRFDVTAQSNLSQQEAHVLRLLCEGKSNPEIASDLILARSTVAGVVSKVFLKLNVSDRAAAAASAIRLGLVD